MTGWGIGLPGWRSAATLARARMLAHRREGTLVLAATMALYLLLSPVLSLLNQTLFLAMASLLRALCASQIVPALLTRMGFDPVYVSVFDRSLGNIEVKGLSVAAPLGDLLHAVQPAWFTPASDALPGAWTSAVVSEGASILASTLATIGAELTFIAVGILFIALVFWRKQAGAMAFVLIVLGLLFQVKGVLGLFGLGITVDDVEAMGLSQVFTKLLPLDDDSYRSIVLEPSRVTGTALVPMGLLFAIYGTTVGLELIAIRTSRRGRIIARRWTRRLLNFAADLRFGRNVERRWRVIAAALALVSTAFLAEHLFPAEARFDRGESSQSFSSSGNQWNTTAGRGDIHAGPSQVTITGTNYQYRYLVNGRPERIRGVGYNPLYSSLPPQEREARYEQDLSRMRNMGINTILGWGPQQFDELLLDKAQEQGLGVVMPYHLPSDGNYADPAYQQHVEDDVLRWVQRFKAYPALRMWGIGNEVIHNMGGNPDTPRAAAFAEFYVRLIDKVHLLDPDHPVTYRDAEDMYVNPMKRALQTNRIARPWLVYGINGFTYRLCDILRDWPKRGIDTPVLVSEFAPAGVWRGDRPNGYLRMWRCITDYPDMIIGGFAYVWSTEGPEILDRSFGLFDGRNTPTDGSVQALTQGYNQDRQSEQ